MTAVVETRAVLRASVKALADPGLTASAEYLLRNQERTATAFHRLRQIAVIEEFLRADKASREASERLHVTDAGGWADDEAERLRGVAVYAWGAVADGWYVMEGSWARRLLVVEEAEDAGAEYAGRRRLVGHAVAQFAPVDWSRGR